MIGKVVVAVTMTGIIGTGVFSPVLMYGESSAQLIAHEHGRKVTTDQPGATGQKIDKENAGNETCPVSGEKIDEKTKVTYEYKGNIYSFCCQDCVEEFKKDPEKYIEKMEKGKAETGGEDQSIHEDHQ